MSNGRFATSIHILTLLSLAGEQWTSSEYLAGSININPAMVRKELVNLRASGLIESREGKSGGSRLARSAGNIRMSEVYAAVRQNDILGKGINSPNPDCPVGSKINQYIGSLYESAEQVLVTSLSGVTLAEFSQKFQ